MASASRITKKNRKRKEAGKGKRRKAFDRTNGSTKSPAELFGDKED